MLSNQEYSLKQSSCTNSLIIILHWFRLRPMHVGQQVCWTNGREKYRSSLKLSNDSVPVHHLYSCWLQQATKQKVNVELGHFFPPMSTNRLANVQLHGVFHSHSPLKSPNSLSSMPSKLYTSVQTDFYLKTVWNDFSFKVYLSNNDHKLSCVKTSWIKGP